jgi:hypothetical protein
MNSFKLFILGLIGLTTSVAANYSIVHERAERCDHGLNYYVLIKPVSSHQEAKTSTQTIVNDLMNESPNQDFGILVFDNADALDMKYESYSNPKLYSDEQRAFIKKHEVAEFQGKYTCQDVSDTSKITLVPRYYSDDGITDRQVDAEYAPNF